MKIQFNPFTSNFQYISDAVQKTGVVDPDLGGGVAASLGELYSNTVNLKLFMKTGALDTDWTFLTSAFGYTPEDSANKDTDITLASNSDVKYPSQKAVKTYIDNKQSEVFITGDIAPDSFVAANNQAVAADVTGLSFNNAETRSFKVLISADVDATIPLFEVFDITGIQQDGGWNIFYTSSGDDSDFIFSITGAGQIQYTNGNYAGFVSATLTFRAYTTSV